MLTKLRGVEDVDEEFQVGLIFVDSCITAACMRTARSCVAALLMQAPACGDQRQLELCAVVVCGEGWVSCAGHHGGCTPVQQRQEALGQPVQLSLQVLPSLLVHRAHLLHMHMPMLAEVATLPPFGESTSLQDTVSR